MSNRYAIVENGVVVNAVLADAEYAAAHGWIACDKAGPGWVYDGQNFIEAPDPTPASTPAPTKAELLAQLQALQAQIQALE